MQPLSKTVEYAVRGEWRRAGDDDDGGEKGTWFIGVPELVKQLGAEVVRAKIAAWEVLSHATGEEAISAAEAESDESERDE